MYQYIVLALGTVFAISNLQVNTLKHLKKHSNEFISVTSYYVYICYLTTLPLWRLRSRVVRQKSMAMGPAANQELRMTLLAMTSSNLPDRPNVYNMG